MAAYGVLAYSNNDLNKNEINLRGDHSGAGAGLIGTGLWNRFALSATTGWNSVFIRNADREGLRNTSLFLH